MIETQFGILGPLEVRQGDRTLPLRGRRQRALLAVLVLHAGEVIASERLIDELWGADAPESGVTALQVRISQLRRALGEGGRLIVTRSPGYVLRAPPESIDAGRFEALPRAAGRSSPTGSSNAPRGPFATRSRSGAVPRSPTSRTRRSRRRRSPG